MSIMQLTQTINILPPLKVRGNRKQSTQPTLPGLEAEQPASSRVTNRQIAEVLASIADLIEGQNGNPYRIQAYRNAARGVLDLPESAVDIITRGDVLQMPGLGERLRKRITELVQFGTMTFQTGLYLQTLPEGVRILMTVEHIGPYSAIRLYDELGIDSVEKLWRAAHNQNIRHLPGFGPRSEARLKIAAEHSLRAKHLLNGAA